MIWIALTLAAVSLALAAASFITGRKFQKRVKRKMRIIESRAWGAANELRRARAALAEFEARSLSQSTDGSPVRFPSLYGEDVYLWWLFDRSTTGTFIEAGALDGVKLSCTYALERLGWNGLLIEPVSAAANACEKNRPNSTVLHRALVSTGGPKQVEIAGISASDRPTLGALSYVPSIADQMSERTESMRERGYEVTIEQVPTTTLNAAIELANIGRPDAIVLDVEGAELDVLDGIDLKHHKPRVLLIEANDGNSDDLMSCNDDTLDGLKRRLEPDGYVLADTLAINAVFIHRDETRLLERATELKAF